MEGCSDALCGPPTGGSGPSARTSGIAAATICSGPEIGHWTAARLGTVYTDQCASALGLVRNGEIVAGVIYENWNGKSLMAHMVVEGALTPAFIASIFDYAYRICGVAKVICPVAVTNKRSARLVEHMGFTAEATLTDCHPDGDLVLYTLRATDCRFLEGRYDVHGQVPATSARAA